MSLACTMFSNAEYCAIHLVHRVTRGNTGEACRLQQNLYLPKSKHYKFYHRLLAFLIITADYMSKTVISSTNAT